MKVKSDDAVLVRLFAGFWALSLPLSPLTQCLFAGFYALLHFLYQLTAADATVLWPPLLPEGSRGSPTLEAGTYGFHWRPNFGVLRGPTTYGPTQLTNFLQEG